MEQELIQYLNDHEVIYYQITNSDTLIKIHDLFINNNTNICDQDMTNGELLLYHGLYYFIKSDKIKMDEYLLRAIDYGNVPAMNKYANWCMDHKMHDNAQKYYLMAIEHGNIDALFNYALWNEEHGTKEDTQKYYLMAIEHGDTDAMNNYAIWCINHGTKEDVQKYYLMAINNDHVDASYNYVNWCLKNNNLSYKKYFILGCKNNHFGCKTFINENLILFLDNIDDIYNYLSNENKNIVNNIIISTYQITNINILNESLCLTCQYHKKCLFLSCGHPQCFSCWSTPCVLCDKH